MADGTQFRGRVVSLAKAVFYGLFRDPLSDPGGPFDSCAFDLVTGTTALPDITFTAGTTVLIPAADVPKGCKVYITSVQVVATTGFSGGTGGTVSLTLEGTDGTDIATYTQTALAANAYLPLPTTTPATGVTDVSNTLALMGASTAANVGLQVLKANSTAGVARFRIRGYFAP